MKIRSNHRNCRFKNQKKDNIDLFFFYYYYSKRIVHQEFIPEEYTANGAFYQSFFDRSCKIITYTRSNLWKYQYFFFLLNDNASTHFATINTQFWTRKMIPVFSHLFYSLDSSPFDYFLFPKLKIELKGDGFGSIEEIRGAVTRKLNSISKNDFSKAVDMLEERISIM